MKRVLPILLLAMSPQLALPGDREASTIDHVQDPVLTAITEPEYPDLAFDLRLQGKVVVTLHVDSDGTPVRGRITQSSASIFDEVALAAALRSRFSPAVGPDGRSVASVVRIPFVFRIR